MTARATAIIVAAGTGERMGGEGPKAFLELGGRPLLWWSLQSFAEAGVADLVVVTTPDRCSQARALARDAGFADAAVVPGGATRQASVEQGLRHFADGVVAVHDAARPLLSADLIRRTIEALEPPWGAVAPALPVVDTLKEVDGQRVIRTVDREGLWAVQTPQVFLTATLARVHATVDMGATDDLALVEQAGEPVRLIEGERCNFKVTYPEDLVVAEALLGAR